MLRSRPARFLFSGVLALGVTTSVSCSDGRFLGLGKKKGSGTASNDPHAHHTHHGATRKPTITAQASGGNASNPATWGGRLPVEGDVLGIPSGSVVTLDAPLPPLDGLVIEGTLRVERKDTKIEARFIHVDGGTFEAGTAKDPFLQKLEIVLVGLPPEEAHVAESVGTKGFVVTDGILDLHGAPRTRSWTFLNGDVRAGDTAITLAEDAGWVAGDRIVIATSTRNQGDVDVATVTRVSGRTLTLSSPLKHAHTGSVKTFSGASIDMRAEVGRLNRNIVIRGDDDSYAKKFGAHMMFMASKSVTTRLSNVEITAAGQFDRDGRYPIHWHVVEGRCGECYVKDSSIHDTIQRGIVVHDTRGVTVENNIVYSTVGHNVIVETERTEGNRFLGNLALVNKSPSPPFTNKVLKLQSDEIPGNYWVRNHDNLFEGNASAGSLGIGFFFEKTHGKKMTFRKNRQHAAMAEGVERDFNIQPGILLFCDDGVALGKDSVVSDVISYHNGLSGFWPEVCNNYESNSAFQSVFERITVADSSLKYSESHVRLRGVADAYTFKDLVLIGSTTSERATSPAVGLQYGGHARLINPTFVRFAGRMLQQNDTGGPTQSKFFVQGAKILDSDLDEVTKPDEKLGIVALDDSYLPKGYHLDPTFPGVTRGDCAPRAHGAGTEVESFLFCASNVRQAILVVREGDKEPAEDDDGMSGGTALWTTHTLSRSDGVVLKKVTDGGMGWPLAVGMPFITSLVANTTKALSIVLTEAYDESKGIDPSALALFSASRAAAPKGVWRTGAPQDGKAFGPLHPKAGTALTAAESLDAFRANPRATYHYDAASKVLTVGATVEWLYVE